MATVPDRARAREWVGIPDTLLPDADLDTMLAGALGNIARVCRAPMTPDGLPDITSTLWPDALVESALRRVQRSVAVKALPLGYVDLAGEYGPAKVPVYDAHIEALEGPYRKVVFG